MKSRLVTCVIAMGLGTSFAGYECDSGCGDTKIFCDTCHNAPDDDNCSGETVATIHNATYFTGAVNCTLGDADCDEGDCANIAPIQATVNVVCNGVTRTVNVDICCDVGA